MPSRWKSREEEINSNAKISNKCKKRSLLINKLNHLSRIYNGAVFIYDIYVHMHTLGQIV